MLVLVALVGILSLLVVVLTSVAYLALPSGRMCPSCGVPTSSILLESWWQRPASRWLYWRWCARCGWEGVGRKGPDVGLQDRPVDHESGFRWRRPGSEQVPIFHWRDDSEDPSGFRWAADEDAEGVVDEESAGTSAPEGVEGHLSGFRWGARDDAAPLFVWGGSALKSESRSPVPWYLSWLPPRRTSGFRWKPRD